MNNRRLVTWITFLAVFAMSARISMDPDTWWHLRAGEWILEHRAVPQTDLFSYTRYGEPWQYPGWLVEVPMALIYRALGPGGLNMWTAVMVTLAFVFLWRTLSGGPILRAFIVVLAATVSAVYWAARPYLVTFLFAAVFLWILEDFRWSRVPPGSRRLLWLPVLMVIWANSHGGFAVGFLLWGIYLAGELIRDLVKDEGRKTKEDSLPFSSFILHPSSFAFHPSSSAIRLLIIGALMLLAVCLNPYGPVMLAYPFKTVGIGALQDYIQEWQSPDFHSLSVQPFAWLLLLTLAAVGASRRRLALTDFLLVAGFGYMGLLAGRNIALFALAAPPVLARHAAPLLQAWGRSLGLRLDPDRPLPRRLERLNLALLAVLIAAVLFKVSLVLPVQANQEVWDRTLPVQAVEYLRRERPPGRLFNTYNWGGYLLWALPEYPVFVDGRTDLYDDELIDEWVSVVQAEEGWQGVLNRWDVRLILLEPDRPVVRLLAGEGWRLLYQDEVAVVYAK